MLNDHEHKNTVNGKSHGKITSKRKALMIMGALLLLVIVAVSALALPLFFHKSPAEALIKVPQGATDDQVCDSISKYLGDDFASHVSWGLRFIGFRQGNHHGAYLITEGMSPLKAANMICKNRQSGINVVINGQRTKADLARRLASYLDFSEEEMLAALNDKELLGKYETGPSYVMGFFLNDTYQFYWTATPEEVIAKMSKHYRSFWTNKRQIKAEDLGLSPRQVTILSTIVDEETNVADEKGRIGRLYINRIDQHMKLQSDPTVRFALNDFTIKRISLEDTKVDSEYNTYLHEGLPKGHLRTPEAATIDSILNSRPSSDLYMCADPSLNGRHRFAATYAEHQRNAAEYQAKLDQLQIHRNAAAK